MERLKYLLDRGVPAGHILVLTPQRSLQDPYLDILRSPLRVAGGEVTPATLGGLARRACDLFWPLAAEAAGFAWPDQPPTFLTLESAQYYMAWLVRPLLAEGRFQSVTIDRNRLYSQIIDNLNKAAVVGFPYTDFGARLDAAWFGDPGQRRIYSDAQECANRFRGFCLEHNLLDFSLQLDTFMNILWPLQAVKDFLTGTYRHLIYDNLEEDGPRLHDLIRDWLPAFDSALLIYDEGGGYRRFLGADTKTGQALSELCAQNIVLDPDFVMSDEVRRLDQKLKQLIHDHPSSDSRFKNDEETVRRIVTRFYPELLDAIADEIQQLTSSGHLAPSEIVILTPYLSDALRFALTSRLESRSLAWRSHRPSRSLHDEPASHALVVLAALAHPHWNIHPPKFDLASALMLAIQGLDLVRALLLAGIVYRPNDLRLSTFDEINVDVQERITYVIGSRYTLLRDWLMAYRESLPLPLDHFFRSLFGEVLSQPGFGYHQNLDAVRVAASLVESVFKFRQAMEPSFVNRDRPDFDFGKEYLTMLAEGVIAATYLEAWRPETDEAVLVAPAHTFLMLNRPVSVQFWLDIGSTGWHERLAQPLTHPYVLSREWETGRLWTDADEVQTSRESMARLVSGLLHRCKGRIYIGLSELGESGFEQRGELLRAFQKILSAEN